MGNKQQTRSRGAAKNRPAQDGHWKPIIVGALITGGATLLAAYVAINNRQSPPSDGRPAQHGPVADSDRGRLSVSYPPDQSDLRLAPGVDGFRTSVGGRCSGLGDELGPDYEITVLVTSQLDEGYWVQPKPAVINLVEGTWLADVHIGDKQNQPKAGQKWSIVAVAVTRADRIVGVRKIRGLGDLPRHVQSNYVTVTTVKSG